MTGDRHRQGRNESRGVWLLAAGQTVVWACLYYGFAALLPRWEAALGWGKATLSLGLTVAVLTAAAAAPLAGRAVDAGRGTALLGLGAAVGAVGLTLLAATESRAGFLAAWTVIGAAQAACLYEPCFAVTTRALGALARPAVTRITLVAGFASTLAFPAWTAGAEALGWRGAALAAAAVCAAVGAPLLVSGARSLEGAAGPAAPRRPRREDDAAARAALGRPAFWLIGIGFSAMALNHGILLNHILPLLAERGVAEGTAVAVAATFGPAQVAGRLGAMAVERRVGAAPMAAVAFSAAVGAALLLAIAGGATSVLFAFAAAQGAAFGLVSLLRPVVTAERLGLKAFGRVSGLLAAPYLAASAAAAPLGAALWSLGGYGLAVACAALCAALGLAATLALARAPRA